MQKALVIYFDFIRKFGSILHTLLLNVLQVKPSLLYSLKITENILFFW